MTLAELLKECRKGSIIAQKYLYDKYVVQMFLLCRRYLKEDSVAEECMLNGFLKFFNSLSKFVYDNDASTTAWIKKIMVNECLQQLRQKNNFQMVSEAEALDVPIDEGIIERMSADEIYRKVLQLPVGYRTIFNLYVMEGMSHKQIADALGIKEGTSKSQLSKAKQLLQQLIISNNTEYATRRVK